MAKIFLLRERELCLEIVVFNSHKLFLKINHQYPMLKKNSIFNFILFALQYSVCTNAYWNLNRFVFLSVPSPFFKFSFV